MNTAAAPAVHRSRPFRFESLWISKDECKKIVHDSWSTQGEAVGWEA